MSERDPQLLKLDAETGRVLGKEECRPYVPQSDSQYIYSTTVPSGIDGSEFLASHLDTIPAATKISSSVIADGLIKDVVLGCKKIHERTQPGINRGVTTKYNRLVSNITKQSEGPPSLAYLSGKSVTRRLKAMAYKEQARRSSPVLAGFILFDKDKDGNHLDLKKSEGLLAVSTSVLLAARTLLLKEELPYSDDMKWSIGKLVLPSQTEVQRLVQFVDRAMPKSPKM